MQLYITMLANFKMKYLPYENITYKSMVDSKEILNRIGEIIEPKKTFRMSGVSGNNDHKPYEGYIKGNSFNITRIIEYQNSFLPRIKGNIENSFGTTKINVQMRLHPFVLVFTLLWCSAAGLGFLAVLSSSIVKGIFEPTMFMPLVMLLFGYGLATGGFKYESKKSKQYLAQLFDAEIMK